jgi:flagellar basal body-associated protein FliL
MGAPSIEPVAPVKRKRRTLLIVSLVLVGVLVLCGGIATTAYVVTTKQSGTGQADPVAAVDHFLTAVYTDRNPSEAAKYVCTQSNDSGQIQQKINEVKTAQTKYAAPRYRWDTPAVAKQTTTEATLTATVQMTTDDEKQASEDLTFTTTKKNGWWVCEVTTGK